MTHSQAEHIHSQIYKVDVVVVPIPSIETDVEVIYTGVNKLIQGKHTHHPSPKKYLCLQKDYFINGLFTCQLAK